jgi:predicted naringenin-chalcone synthase
MSNAALLEIPVTQRAAQVALLGIGTAAPPSAEQTRLLDFALETLHGAPAPSAPTLNTPTLSPPTPNTAEPNSAAPNTAAARVSALVASPAWLKRVYRNSGITRRGSVLLSDNPFDPFGGVNAFYAKATCPNDRGPTTAARMARYTTEAPPLAERAARAALGDARSAPADITHIVTASCTGFFAPGLDSDLIERLSLPRDISRTHIGFMGCHAAVNALAVATAIARADASARVLVCCVELCSLHLAYGADADKMVSNALFADGAAAVVVGRAEAPESGEWRTADFASAILPDCRDAMGWCIGDHGFEMTLSPGVPAAIEKHLHPWLSAWLARHDLEISDIAAWAVHPGGPKILDAVAAALHLPPSALATSRAVLNDHGNMSSPTILFILQRLAAADARGPCVAIGLGPGLAAEAMLLHR